MSNPITMNRVERTSNSYSYRKATTTVGNGAFGAALQAQSEAAKAARTTDVFQAAETQTVSTKDMTLDEYKDYLRGKIDSLPVHPDNLCDSWTIHISDASFQALKDDPEFEKWLIDDLGKAFATPYPAWARSIGGPGYVVTTVGTKIGEAPTTSWHQGYMNGTGDLVWAEKTQGSFWTRKGENSGWSRGGLGGLWEKRQQKAEIEEAAEKRRRRAKKLQEELVEKALQRRDMARYFGEMQYYRSLAARSLALGDSLPTSMPNAPVPTGVSAAELLDFLM